MQGDWTFFTPNYVSSVKKPAKTQLNDKYDADKDDFNNPDDPTSILSVASNLLRYFPHCIIFLFSFTEEKPVSTLRRRQGRQLTQTI